jgi:hypothetical protein
MTHRCRNAHELKNEVIGGFPHLWKYAAGNNDNASFRAQAEERAFSQRRMQLMDLEKTA